MSSDPVEQFQNWFKEAKEVEKAVEVNAMTLATCGKDMMPSVRYLLLKEVSEGGFVFFTNYGSLKAQQIEQNSNVSCMFYWPTCNRSVRVEGTAVKVSPEESSSYFDSRALKSRIASSVSRQSKKISPEEKESMIKKIETTLEKAEKGEVKI